MKDYLITILTKYYTSRKSLKIDLPAIRGKSEKITIYGGYILEVNDSLMRLRVRNGFNPKTIHQVSNQGIDIKVNSKFLEKIKDLVTNGKLYEKTKTQLRIE